MSVPHEKVEEDLPGVMLDSAGVPEDSLEGDDNAEVPFD